MRYEEPLYRPPSEADAYILQATIGCSWNHCVYCDMYRGKDYRVRDLDAVLEDLALAGANFGDRVQKLFVADGDALGMPTTHWLALLDAARTLFPRLRRVSCYATARNLLQHDDGTLKQLKEAGLSRLYIGPESGHDPTLKRIAKGADHAQHVAAAERAHGAGMELSVIVMLGVGGEAHSEQHALQTARLITEMDPEFLGALTTTIQPRTPLYKLSESGRFKLPDVMQMFRELRTLVAEARPTRTLFRTNHASNYLAIGGTLPEDRAQILQVIDQALRGDLPLRPEHRRGL